MATVREEEERLLEDGELRLLEDSELRLLEGEGRIIYAERAQKWQQAQPVRDVGSLGYITNVDESVSGTTYIGEAPIGSSDSEPVWQISRVTVAADITKTRYAEGDSDRKDKVWDKRADYTYL